MTKKYLWGVAIALAVFSLTATKIASADHAWGNYHWARAANPFTLAFGDNVAGNWDAYLNTASADWSLSSVLDTAIVAGVTNPKNCKAVFGRVEVCNSKYGRNGWLGIASIWVGGEHITQGTVKMNDTYFITAKYNTPAWRQLVLCQEVGHTLGLDHQDEDFNNLSLGSCMDYTSDPTPNQHPNAHDYEMLESIYAHLDNQVGADQTGLANGGQDIDHNDRRTWGKEIRISSDKRTSVFERDLGRGQKVFTFVTWAE